MQLFVNMPSGLHAILSVDPEASIESVQVQIHRAVGVRPAFQRLTFGGKELQRGRVLADYGMRSSTLSVPTFGRMADVMKANRTIKLHVEAPSICQRACPYSVMDKCSDDGSHRGSVSCDASDYRSLFSSNDTSHDADPSESCSLDSPSSSGWGCSLEIDVETVEIRGPRGRSSKAIYQHAQARGLRVTSRSIYPPPHIRHNIHEE